MSGATGERIGGGRRHDRSGGAAAPTDGADTSRAAGSDTVAGRGAGFVALISLVRPASRSRVREAFAMSSADVPVTPLPPAPPAAAAWAGLALFAAGWAVVLRTLETNAFAVRVVRHQPERGHHSLRQFTADCTAKRPAVRPPGHLGGEPEQARNPTSHRPYSHVSHRDAPVLQLAIFQVADTRTEQRIRPRVQAAFRYVEHAFAPTP